MKIPTSMHCLCFLVAFFGFPPTTWTAELHDRAVTFAVERQMADDPVLPSQFIDVETRDGVVLLSGWVDNLLAKERAVEMAEIIKGVRAVVNDIAVDPIDRKDEDLLNDIREALAGNPAVREMRVGVEVRNGAVTLTGRVDSWAEKQLVSQLVKEVWGVKELHNNMELELRDIRLDRHVEQEIAERLKWDVWVDASQIRVDVSEGHVTLAGIVGSAAEKSRAHRLALIAGVKSVDTGGLRVDWMMHHQTRRTELPRPSNEDIQKAVKDALMHDPRLARKEISVEAMEGVVILSGIVDTLEARNAAGTHASNTVGVWRVQNHLKVRPATGAYPFPPHRAYSYEQNRHITDAARAALLRDPFVSQHEITVHADSVYRGIVFLSGRVRSEYEKERAEEIVSRIGGIARVHSDIEVRRTWERLPDWEIKEEIEDKLWWSPFVDESGVSVSVEDGIATLIGVVEDLKERRDATRNAYEGGAKEVRNFLKVKQGPKVLAP
jgi:osmotically-inducible protein OsmY